MIFYHAWYGIYFVILQGNWNIKNNKMYKINIDFQETILEQNVIILPFIPRRKEMISIFDSSEDEWFYFKVTGIDYSIIDGEFKSIVVSVEDL